MPFYGKFSCALYDWQAAGNGLVVNPGFLRNSFFAAKGFTFSIGMEGQNQQNSPVCSLCLRVIHYSVNPFEGRLFRVIGFRVHWHHLFGLGLLRIRGGLHRGDASGRSGRRRKDFR